jgi:hypothetical protein
MELLLPALGQYENWKLGLVCGLRETCTLTSNIMRIRRTDYQNE